jgi:hypothetical protein
MLMIPLIGFFVGVVISELWQWGAWKAKHTSKEFGWFGYWGVGLPHLMMNLGGDATIACLWSSDLLDDVIIWVVSFIPGTSNVANVGIPYTPQIGIMLGFASDLFADQGAFVLRIAFRMVVDKVPFLKGLMPKSDES